MGIFFTSPQPVLPAIESAMELALAVEPHTVKDLKKEAAHRTMEVHKHVVPQFNPWRFGGAAVIAVALVLAAIWAEQHQLADISKVLIDSFSGYSGVVLGLLGGEAQGT